MVSTRIEGNLTQLSREHYGKLLGEMTISFFFLSVPSLYPQTQSILNAWHLVYTELNVNFNKFVNINRNYFQLTFPCLFKQR